MFHVEHSAEAALGSEPTAGPDAGLIREVLAEAGIGVSDADALRLAAHAGEMLRWNRSIRLTAITDPVEVAVKHVADSLLLLRFAPFPGDLLDFGSGAGYPGIPLAVCLPGTRVTLLEATAKKCAFLSRVRSILSLHNVEVRNARLDPKRPAGPFDGIVTRATLSPPEAVALLAPHLAPGGRLLLMTGEGDGRRTGGGARPAGERDKAAAILTRREAFLLPRGMGRRLILEYSAAAPDA